MPKGNGKGNHNKSEKRHNTKSKGYAKIKRARALRAKRSAKRHKEQGEDQ